MRKENIPNRARACTFAPQKLETTNENKLVFQSLGRLQQTFFLFAANVRDVRARAIWIFRRYARDAQIRVFGAQYFFSFR